MQFLSWRFMRFYARHLSRFRERSGSKARERVSTCYSTGEKPPPGRYRVRPPPLRGGGDKTARPPAGGEGLGMRGPTAPKHCESCGQSVCSKAPHPHPLSPKEVVQFLSPLLAGVYRKKMTFGDLGISHTMCVAINSRSHTEVVMSVSDSGTIKNSLP